MSKETENLPANPFGGNVALANATQMAERLGQSATSGARGGIDGSVYLNFSGKRGVYEFGGGDDREELSSDEIWLVNIASFQDGYVCWRGGQPVDTRLANIYTDPVVPAPNADEHGPFTEQGDGWFKAKAMVLKSVEEDDRQGYFKINSVSGVDAFAKLQADVADRLRAGEPAWPLVQLDREAFTARGHKNFKPSFKIYGWLDEAALAALAEDPEADIDGLIEEAGGAAEEAEEEEKASSRKASRGKAGRRTRL